MQISAYLGGINRSISVLFRPKISGLEYLKNSPQKLLIISNHNVGAIIESHLILCLFNKTKPGEKVLGFTHPSLFKIPLMSQYFKWIGAVPSTHVAAAEVFNANSSLLIFPGGNDQALRGVWDYKKNNFINNHGWAKIAVNNKVPVLPVTFKNTHFLNPVVVSSKLLSKILILPHLLGVSAFSVTVSQIILGILTFKIMSSFSSDIIAGFLSWVVFCITPLVPILPLKIECSFHPIIYPENFGTREELESKVANIYDGIYK